MGKNKELFMDMLTEIADVAIQFDNGDIEILNALTQLENYKGPLQRGLDVIKHFKDQNTEEIDAASKNFKDGYGGYLIEVRNGGRMLNFKGIEEWQECDELKKDCEKKYKTMLDAKIAGNANANISKDGEVLELPVVTYRKSSVILKEKKL